MFTKPSDYSSWIFAVEHGMPRAHWLTVSLEEDELKEKMTLFYKLEKGSVPTPELLQEIIINCKRDAFSFILSSITEKYHYIIRHVDGDPKKAIQAFKDTYAKNTWNNTHIAQRKFFHMKMEPGETLGSYSSRILDAAELLASMGHGPDEHARLTVLLLGLPKGIENLVTTLWAARGEDANKLTWNTAVAAIQDELDRREATESFHQSDDHDALLSSAHDHKRSDRQRGSRQRNTKADRTATGLYRLSTAVLYTLNDMHIP